MTLFGCDVVCYCVCGVVGVIVDVRNIKSGEVRAVIGQTYLLNENEQLWEKVCLF